jgi:hypothetical protein
MEDLRPLIDHLWPILDKYEGHAGKRNELAELIEKKGKALAQLCIRQHELNLSFEPDANESGLLIRNEIDATRTEIEKLKRELDSAQKFAMGFENIVDVLNTKIAECRPAPPPPPPKKLPFATRSQPSKKAIDDDDSEEEEDDDASTTESDSEKPSKEKKRVSYGPICRSPDKIREFLGLHVEQMKQFLPPNRRTGDKAWKCVLNKTGYTTTVAQHNELDYPGIIGFKAAETGGKQRFYMQIAKVRVDSFMNDDLKQQFTFEDPRDCKEVLFKIVQLYKVWCKENGYKPITNAGRELTGRELKKKKKQKRG